MTGGSLLAVAIKGGAAATVVLLGALGLAAVMAMAAALFRSAVDASEARSRGDVSSQLRALDELVSLGSLKPDEYASRRAALLHEN
jgi:Zn-dependent alcohol dehydrogenase